MIRFCTRCVISNQRPRITFDAEGVCSACRFAEKKAQTNWAGRELGLWAICNQFRGRGDWDVVVPCSGGKDGGFVAHQLKHVYGMNPLCVTWSPLMPTDHGRGNLERFIASGFDVIAGHGNGQTARRLARVALEKMGDPFQPFIYGQTNFPLRVAMQHGIKLIMYGENGEVEYGGDMKNAERPSREVADHDGHYFSGKPPSFWAAEGFKASELRPFEVLAKGDYPQIHFMSYYKRWDPQENFYYCVEHTGFEPNEERSEGTYSKYASLDDKLDGLHYYLGYAKFGIGRCTSDAAHEIRDGKITREEAVALVRKYDGEFPRKCLPECLEYLGLSEAELVRIIETWKSPEVWDGDKLIARVE